MVNWYNAALDQIRSEGEDQTDIGHDNLIFLERDISVNPISRYSDSQKIAFSSVGRIVDTIKQDLTRPGYQAPPEYAQMVLAHIITAGFTEDGILAIEKKREQDDVRQADAQQADADASFRASMRAKLEERKDVGDFVCEISGTTLLKLGYVNQVHGGRVEIREPRGNFFSHWDEFQWAKFNEVVVCQ